MDLKIIHKYHLYAESKIWYKWTYLWNRYGLTDIENRLVVAKGVRVGRRNLRLADEDASYCISKSMEKQQGTTVLYSSVQFHCSVVSDSLRPHGLQHSRPPCPSPTPEVYSSSCPLSQWCHPTISSSVIPFSSYLQSFSATISLSSPMGTKHHPPQPGGGW